MNPNKDDIYLSGEFFDPDDEEYDEEETEESEEEVEPEDSDKTKEDDIYLSGEFIDDDEFDTSDDDEEYDEEETEELEETEEERKARLAEEQRRAEIEYVARLQQKRDRKKARKRRAGRVMNIIAFILGLGTIAFGLMFFLGIGPVFEMNASALLHMGRKIPLKPNVLYYIWMGLILVFVIRLFTRFFYSKYKNVGKFFSFLSILVFSAYISLSVFAYTRLETNEDVIYDIQDDAIVVYDTHSLEALDIITGKPDAVVYLDTYKNGKQIYYSADLFENVPYGINVVLRSGAKDVKLNTTCFQNRTKIKSVSIPNNVVSMNQGIFAGCTSITYLKLPFMGENASSVASLSYLFTDPSSTISLSDSSSIENVLEMELYSVTVQQGTFSKESFPTVSIKKISLVEPTEIQRGTFMNVLDLESITITGDPVIQEYAFEALNCEIVVGYSLYTKYSLGSKYPFHTFTVKSTDEKGSFTKEYINVCYDLGNGEIQTVVCNEGDYLKEITPERKGYRFDGFITKDGKKWDFSTNKVTGNTTIYAQWTPIRYTLKLLNYDGSLLDSRTQTYDEEYEVNVYERLGYDFLGWTYENSNEIQFEKNIINATDTEGMVVVLYAKYQLHKYKVTLVSNPENQCSHCCTQNQEQKIEYTSLPKLESKIPTRLGYKFMGYSTAQGLLIFDENGTASAYWNIASDTKLFASWEILPEYEDATFIYTVNDVVKMKSDGRYILANCLDFSGVDYFPIDNFNGSLESKNCIIKNWTLYSSENHMGFVRNLYGSISGITFENCSIYNECWGDNSLVGIVAGEIKSNGSVSNCTITNCVVFSKAIDYDNIENSCRWSIAGMVAGKTCGYIGDCYVTNATIYCYGKKHDYAWSSGWDEMNYVYAGGIVGENMGGKVENNSVSIKSFECYAEYRVNSIWPIVCDARSRICMGGIIGRSEDTPNMKNNIVRNTIPFYGHFYTWNDTYKVNAIEQLYTEDSVGYVG